MFTYSNIISTVGRTFFPSLLWNFNRNKRIIYLTFDDGPIPEVTPWVLRKLKEYNAKATFFCIGDNVLKNPEFCKMILEDGHVIANHSHNHLNGWKTGLIPYISNVSEAESVIQKFTSHYNKSSTLLPTKKLFRPPYGRIRPSQIKELESLNYKIVMWDVISRDYDQARSAKTSINQVIRFAKPGSIIVFHDSLKAFKNLQVILPEVLSYYTAEGFEFKSL